MMRMIYVFILFYFIFKRCCYFNIIKFIRPCKIFNYNLIKKKNNLYIKLIMVLKDTPYRPEGYNTLSFRIKFLIFLKFLSWNAYEELLIKVENLNLWTNLIKFKFSLPKIRPYIINFFSEFFFFLHTTFMQLIFSERR